MKENFPNPTKEKDFQKVQEAQSPKEFEPKEEHNQDTSTLSYPRLKMRES